MDTGAVPSRGVLHLRLRKMRDKLFTLATILVVMCALVSTSLLVKREFDGSGHAEGPRFVRNARALETGTLLGARDAAMKIVEFSDFQCPYCARVQPTLRALRAKYPADVAVVYRHNPLESLHPHARAAAMAASCAEEQGRFEALHDVLYERQDSIGVSSWRRFAELAKVPRIEAFETCVREERYRARLERDMKAASDAGLNGTPTFVVNGRVLTGARTLAEFEVAVQAALNR